jgi:hypothetical protein
MVVRGDAAHHCNTEFDMVKGKLAQNRGYRGPETGSLVNLGGLSAVTRGLPIGPTTETLGDYVSVGALAQDVERPKEKRASRVFRGAKS